MAVVFDACAVIAHLCNEPGGDVFWRTLSRHGGTIHAVNLAEVYYTLLKSQRYTLGELDQAIEGYVATGLIVSEDLSPAIWKEAARFRSSVGRIAFADCFAVAEALKHGCPVLTSDRKEFDRPEVLRQVGVVFFR